MVMLPDARAPEGLRLYAIGDVHGRSDLLADMHQRIARDLTRRPATDWRVIHLGDYVDRGPDSAGVLALLLDYRSADVVQKAEQKRLLDTRTKDTSNFLGKGGRRQRTTKRDADLFLKSLHAENSILTRDDQNDLAYLTNAEAGNGLVQRDNGRGRRVLCRVGDSQKMTRDRLIPVNQLSKS